MSLRLEQIPYEFEGKTYMLRCNMAVLEDIQEAHGGNLEEALDPDHAIHSAVEFLTAMLNDYADDQGWEERWTPAQLKRRISHAMLMELDLVSMLFRSLSPARKENTPEAGSAEPADSGN